MRKRELKLFTVDVFRSNGRHVKTIKNLSKYAVKQVRARYDATYILQAVEQATEAKEARKTA